MIICICLFVTSFSLFGLDLPRWHVSRRETLLRVPCTEDEVPEAPVEAEVAVSVVVMVGVVVEVQFASIVGEEGVDAGQETDG